MISYETALKKLQSIPPIESQESVPIEHALERVLAHEIHAPCDLPLFDNSAMDGVALRLNQLSKPVVIEGTRFAKRVDDAYDVSQTQAIRIMTGAKVPRWAECVVPNENLQGVKSEPETLKITNPESFKLGTNIRKKGEDFKKGERVFDTYHYVTPESLMVLSSFGLDTIKVIKRPKIWLATTGDEVKEPGESLKDGEVYNASGLYLRSQLYQMGLNIGYQRHLRDDARWMTHFLLEWLETSGPSLLITTGAVSVGQKDELANIALKLPLKIHFHKCAIRPGKPVLLASNHGSHVWIGAPGNAISTATCWNCFIRPLLATWAHLPMPKIISAPLARAVQKPKGLKVFYRGRFDGERVLVSMEQGSQRLKPSVDSNVLVVLPEKTELCPKDTVVSCIVL